MGSSSWSRDPEDLSSEPLLRSSPRLDLNGELRPSVGRYILLSKLGEGGMGTVYHATHQTLGNEVAVKVMQASAAGGQPEVVARFKREARLLAQIKSPHLVGVLDVADDPESNCHFIVMEYVHGISASQWLKRVGDRVDEAAAIEVCLAATQGLAAAHRQGIVHRDIKPANILIPCDERGTPLIHQAKLCDLGLARFETTEGEVTRTNTIMGTPGYMAPEQAASAKNAKKPADVLSMGATLFKLLTGHAPFINPETKEWLHWTAIGKHQDPRAFRPEITDATAHVLTTCLKLEPAERFPDATALLEALRLCRREGSEDMDATTVVDAVQSLVSQPEAGAEVVVSQPESGAPVRDERGSESETLGQPLPDPPMPDPETTPAPTAPTVPAPSRTEQVSKTAAGGGSRIGVGVAVLVLLLAVVGLFAWSPWDGAPGGGEVSVTSTPAGALVAIDGSERGRTPVSVAGVTAGRHVIRLTLADHAASDPIEVDVVAGQPTPVHADLVPAVGTLSIVSCAPRAKLTMARVGGSPLQYEFALDGLGASGPRSVEVGRYEVGARAEGFLPRQLEVRVTADEVTVQPLVLEPEDLGPIAALLRGRDAWNAATSADRRAAAAEVAAKTDGFSFARLETAEAAGLAHDVAVFTHARTGLEFVLVPVDTFVMGSPDDEKGRADSEIQHPVRLTRPFLIARTECTQAAWDSVGGEDRRTWRDPAFPIEGVSWREVTAWTEKAGLRLPSEAEWEYACRAGTTGAFSLGEDLTREQANFASGTPVPGTGPRTKPVASYAANAFGLFDVHGNVWEWCRDVYVPAYTATQLTDPVADGDGESRVVRGGGWLNDLRMQRSAKRLGRAPTERADYVGFRPARSVPLQ